MATRVYGIPLTKANLRCSSAGIELPANTNIDDATYFNMRGDDCASQVSIKDVLFTDDRCNVILKKPSLDRSSWITVQTHAIDGGGTNTTSEYRCN